MGRIEDSVTPLEPFRSDSSPHAGRRPVNTWHTSSMGTSRGSQRHILQTGANSCFKSVSDLIRCVAQLSKSRSNAFVGGYYYRLWAWPPIVGAIVCPMSIQVEKTGRF